MWGETKNIRNHYNELVFTLTQAQTERSMLLRFRVFDDGLGFRYEFPRQAKLSYFVVKEEHTQFALSGDQKPFGCPATTTPRNTRQLRQTSPRCAGLMKSAVTENASQTVILRHRRANTADAQE